MGTPDVQNPDFASRLAALDRDLSAAEKALGSRFIYAKINDHETKIKVKESLFKAVIAFLSSKFLPSKKNYVDIKFGDSARTYILAKMEKEFKQLSEDIKTYENKKIDATFSQEMRDQLKNFAEYDKYQELKRRQEKGDVLLPGEKEELAKLTEKFSPPSYRDYQTYQELQKKENKEGLSEEQQKELEQLRGKFSTGTPKAYARYQELKRAQEEAQKSNTQLPEQEQFELQGLTQKFTSSEYIVAKFRQINEAMTSIYKTYVNTEDQSLLHSEGVTKGLKNAAKSETRFAHKLRDMHKNLKDKLDAYLLIKEKTTQFLLQQGKLLGSPTSLTALIETFKEKYNGSKAVKEKLEAYKAGFDDNEVQTFERRIGEYQDRLTEEFTEKFTSKATELKKEISQASDLTSLDSLYESYTKMCTQIDQFAKDFPDLQEELNAMQRSRESIAKTLIDVHSTKLKESLQQTPATLKDLEQMRDKYQNYLGKMKELNQSNDQKLGSLIEGKDKEIKEEFTKKTEELVKDLTAKVKDYHQKVESQEKLQKENIASTNQAREKLENAQKAALENINEILNLLSPEASKAQQATPTASSWQDGINKFLSLLQLGTSKSQPLALGASSLQQISWTMELLNKVVEYQAPNLTNPDSEHQQQLGQAINQLAEKLQLPNFQSNPEEFFKKFNEHLNKFLKFEEIPEYQNIQKSIDGYREITKTIDSDKIKSQITGIQEEIKQKNTRWQRVLTEFSTTELKKVEERLQQLEKQLKEAKDQVIPEELGKLKDELEFQRDTLKATIELVDQKKGELNKEKLNTAIQYLQHVANSQDQRTDISIEEKGVELTGRLWDFLQKQFGANDEMLQLAQNHANPTHKLLTSSGYTTDTLPKRLKGALSALRAADEHEREAVAYRKTADEMRTELKQHTIINQIKKHHKDTSEGLPTVDQIKKYIASVEKNNNPTIQAQAILAVHFLEALERFEKRKEFEENYERRGRWNRDVTDKLKQGIQVLQETLNLGDLSKKKTQIGQEKSKISAAEAEASEELKKVQALKTEIAEMKA